MKLDNGTNFVGAATELKERLSILDQTEVENFLTIKDIKRRFNPLSAHGWVVVGNHS